MMKWVTRAALFTFLWWLYNYRKESQEHYARMEKLYGYNG